MDGQSKLNLNALFLNDGDLKMQLKDNVEFHNVAELVAYPGVMGLALHRYPKDVIPALTPLGHHAAACADGVELRFVTGANWISLTLSARSNYSFSTGAQVEILMGDILVASQAIPDGATQTIKLTAPPLLAQMKPEAFDRGGFAPSVWRVRLGGATVFYHGLDTAGHPCRPPREDEKPRRRWLAYGSSITNSTPGYVQHAARHLGVDIFNKGMCGSCCCEAEAARFLAACEDWDFATLELGVNLRGGVNAEEFARRARHLVATLRQAAPAKPLVLITIFPNSDDYQVNPNVCSVANLEFRHVLRQIKQDSGDPNLHLIEGDQVLTRFAELSADLIHPTVDGHQLMGANLAHLLEPIVQAM
jgi:lysophospholipase L1-like esterase